MQIFRVHYLESERGWSQDRWYTADALDEDRSVLASLGVSTQVCEFDDGHVWTDVFRDAAARFLAMAAGLLAGRYVPQLPALLTAWSVAGVAGPSIVTLLRGSIASHHRHRFGCHSDCLGLPAAFAAGG